MKTILLATVATVFARAFMSNETCETVTIVGANGDPVRINKSDYDADQAEGGANEMVLHDDNAVAAVEPVTLAPGLTIPPAPSAPASIVNAVAPQTPSPDTLAVTKVGNGAKAKFFVVRLDGSRVEDMRDIDADGYADEASAWGAIHTAKQQPHEQAGGDALTLPPVAPVAPVTA